MPFIVPGVCRYSINGTYLDRNTANILDMSIDTTGSTEPRASACEDQAGIIINEVCDHWLPLLSTAWSFTSVSWVDLDSATGSTGERSSTSQETLPQTGADNTNRAAGNLAILVRKLTTSARGQRTGRFYLPGATEGMTDNANGNIIIPAQLAVMQTNMTSFKGNVEQSDPTPTGYTSSMVVTHILTRDSQGHPLTGDATDVSSLQVQSRVATQRRRLRG